MERLGPEQTKNAIAAIKENRMADFIRIVLVYYDKTYYTGLNRRDKESIVSVDIQNNDFRSNAVKILQIVTLDKTK